MLGGKLSAESRPGEGSTFRLFLPQTFLPQRPARREPAYGGYRVPVSVEREQPPAAEASAPAAEAIGASEAPADRTRIIPGDRALLAVEDAPPQARVLLEAAHANGFKAGIEARGAAPP